MKNLIILSFGTAFFLLAPNLALASPATAVFAGGCFWCMETAYEGQEGISAVVSGYAGGDSDHPSYKAVSSGRSGHLEVIEVSYSPDKISYEDLLAIFWRNVDPFQKNGQFCDRGPQYRSAVFYAHESERKLAVKTKEELKKRFGKTIVTEILPLDAFWPAEDYHQDFYLKSPERYYSYRKGCGRDARLRKIWGDEAGGIGGLH